MRSTDTGQISGSDLVYLLLGCRNPHGVADGVWCYTTETSMDYCNVPTCSSAPKSAEDSSDDVHTHTHAHPHAGDHTHDEPAPHTHNVTVVFHS